MEDATEACPPAQSRRIVGESQLWTAVAWIMGLVATAFLGLVVGMVSGVLKPSTELGADVLAGLGILVVAGFGGATACIAVRRGRSPAWGLLGPLLVLGPLVAVLLPPDCRWCGRRGRGRACPACGAPI